MSLLRRLLKHQPYMSEVDQLLQKLKRRPGRTASQEAERRRFRDLFATRDHARPCTQDEDPLHF